MCLFRQRVLWATQVFGGLFSGVEVFALIGFPSFPRRWKVIGGRAEVRGWSGWVARFLAFEVFRRWGKMKVREETAIPLSDVFNP